MELKIFRDTLPQGGAGCTVKAELPLETDIRISDDLPPVGKLIKCFVRPVVLQRQLQPGRLTLEGYLRCTVFYQSEAEKDLCQTEQKLPFTRQLELPELTFTAWTAVVEGQTEYLNTRAADPRRIEVRGAYGLVVTVKGKLSFPWIKRSYLCSLDPVPAAQIDQCCFRRISDLHTIFIC